MVHLGNNVARLRGFRRLTQKELAGKLNISQQDYSKLEGKEQIDESMLELIAKALDFPVELIRQLDSGNVVSYNQQGGNTGSVFYQVSAPEKLIEVYERLLQSEREKNELLTKSLEAATKK